MLTVQKRAKLLSCCRLISFILAEYLRSVYSLWLKKLTELNHFNKNVTTFEKGVDMYVYVFRSWWECTNDIQIYFCKSLSFLAQSKDSSNQNNNDISGRRESPSKKDMKTKYFFRGQNERVIFTFQCGVYKHTVST